jgi:hypothetical protein
MKNIKKNLLFTLAICTIIFSFAEKSFAVPAAPSPTCAISALVLDNQKTTKQTIGRDAESSNIEYYAVKLKIKTSSLLQKDGYGSCDDLANSEKDSILRLTEYDKSPINIGDQITGKIKFGGDERLGGYFLSDIKVVVKGPTEIAQTKSLEEISASLIDQKQINAIGNISLDNQSYNITGYRYEKLFWFIPVKLKIQLTINAQDGKIQSVVCPWWSFLAR